VKFSSVLSAVVVSNTGPPQGGQVLIILYTNNCTSHQPNQLVMQFSDDTVIMNLFCGLMLQQFSQPRQMWLSSTHAIRMLLFWVSVGWFNCIVSWK